MQEKIQRALEKENLDQEKMINKEEAIKSSQDLQKELDQLAQKVEYHREKKDLKKNYPEVVSKRDQLIQCYRQNKERPLDCWLEAAEFKGAVRKAEQVRFIINR